MARARKTEVRTVVVRQSPIGVITACLGCLGLGLAVGYYFGSQSAPADAAPAPSQSVLSDPSVFLQKEATLRSIVASNPKDLNALVQLGNLYYDNSRFADAVVWYGRALELDPNNPNVRTDRGTSYYNIGQPDNALAEFRKSLDASPNHAQTLYNMGVVYLHGKNDPVQARKAWEQLLATNPGFADRAKVEEQLASLSTSPAAQGSPAGGVEELLEQLKKK